MSEKMYIARTVALAVLFGCIAAAVVSIFAVALGASRLWPGMVIGFLSGTSIAFLCLTRRDAR